MTVPDSGLSTFQAPFAPPDEELAAALLADAARDGSAESRIDARAKRLVEAIRAKAGGLGGIDDFLHAYSLSTKEGLALMVLAEALLRVPDTATADRLIEDKLAAGRWLDSDVHVDGDPGFGLGLDARRRRARHSSGRNAGDDPRQRRASPRPAGHAGSDPAGDAASRLAFRARANHRRRRWRAPAPMPSTAIRSTCSARARARPPMPTNISTPMPERSHAIGKSAGNAAPTPARPGISVKLSALHPRYEAISRERVLSELTPRLIELARLGQGARSAVHRRCGRGGPARTVARDYRCGARRCVACRLGWIWACGAGLSETRALAVIGWIEDAAAAKNRRLTVRLVKGAYWDTEIKRGAGARARRLSGVHAQGHDRSLLHGLRANGSSPRATACFRNSPPTMR